MKKSWKIALIIIASIILLVVVLKALGGDRNVREVSAEEAKRRTIVETVSASGKVQPELEVKIQSEVSGQIIELPVKEGDQVVKGQLLVRINPDIYRSAQSRAEAAVNSAKSALSSARARKTQAEAQWKAADLSYQRNSKLFQEGAISKADFENATSSWEVSKAEMSAAQESISSAEFSIASAMASFNEASDNLSRTTIHAPMEGTVTALTKELGETVLGNNMMAGDIIMKISALATMEVDVEVNESDIVRVAVGDTADIEVDSYTDENFLGLVTEIGNTALNALNGVASLDQVTNFSVKIQILPSSYENLIKDKEPGYSPFRPGMSATVKIKTQIEKNVITVPIRAVTSREDTATKSFSDMMIDKAKKKEEKAESSEIAEPFTVVFIANEANGTAELRVVETGVQDNKYITIKSGVNEGEKVVTDPYDIISLTLKNKDKIKIVDSNSLKKPEE
ncbi:MAG: efflux RND transporter periplasmic adaptor subunit [Flavobacteriales bacterium]|nr:efflux RND transporter periplasmic adaptor subunit [Flavobacteriales bacterium]